MNIYMGTYALEIKIESIFEHCDSVSCQLYTHLSDGLLFKSVGDNLIMPMDVGRPTDCGRHHGLPGILGCRNGEKDLSSIEHLLLSGF